MRGAFAGERGGGLFTLPLGLPLEIPARATDAVLLQFYGHGGVCGAIYTFRGGLNRDGSEDFTTACVDPFGNKTPRYDVASRFGNGLLAQHWHEILPSSEVTAP